MQALRGDRLPSCARESKGRRRGYSHGSPLRKQDSIAWRSFLAHFRPNFAKKLAFTYIFRPLRGQLGGFLSHFDTFAWRSFLISQFLNGEP